MVEAAEAADDVAALQADLQAVDELLALNSSDTEILSVKADLEEAIAALVGEHSPDAEHQKISEAHAAVQTRAPASAIIGPALPPSTAAAVVPEDNRTAISAHQPTAEAILLGRPPAAATEPANLAPPAKRQRLDAGGSGNARMHPANCYAESEPHFAALAARHPDLARHVRIRSDGRGSVDFRSAAASRAVTRALLAEDYGVAWDVAAGQLIPPVPGRANYIAWLADLLALSSPPGTSDIRGLDIGCGANLIYPLLGAAQHGWRFVAADITDVAIEGARANVAANRHLASLIEVRDVREATSSSRSDQTNAGVALNTACDAAADTPPAGNQPEDAGPTAASSAAGAASADATPAAARSGPQPDTRFPDPNFPRGVLAPAVRPCEMFAFSMCNPPFFESLEQAGLNPLTAHEGTAMEMVCPGGEAAFVGAMIADSLHMKHQVHWFTTMLGRKASLKALRAALHRHRPTALRTTEFAQGRTSRWGLAWSWTVDRNSGNRPLVRQQRPATLALAPLQRHAE